MPIDKRTQNYINHIAIVMDGSGSMAHLRGKVVEVVDKLGAHLATQSKDMKQEARITVYVFDDVAECIYFDMDALRLPTVANGYRIGGMTALVDATMLAITDLELTATKYGDHSFLIYVVTDGRENASSLENKRSLPGRIAALAPNWTLGTLVPDVTGVHQAKQLGFPAGNIAVWDTTSEAGLEEAARVVKASVDQYMTNRSSGIVGTQSLFSTDASVLNAQTVAAAGLQPVDPGTYMFVPVIHQMPILEFVENYCGRKYVVGTCFYQLNKSEIIQGHKELYVQDKKSSLLYGGPRVRDLIGLGHEKRRVSPSFNKDYNIFVQSTSLNRNLVPSTQLLIKTS